MPNRKEWDLPDDAGDPDESEEALDDEEFPIGDGVADLVGEVYCPYCGEPVEITLDPGSGTHQQYIEDCQVCCRPNRLTIVIDKDLGSAEVGLRVIAIFAVAIGLTGMLVALYSSLEARRREMAILRAVGAGPRMIISLLVLESGLLALLGCLIGVAAVYLGLFLAQGPIEQRFGLHLALHPLRSTEWTYLAVVMGAGLVIGFVPAWKAYRTSLVDGLSPRA